MPCSEPDLGWGSGGSASLSRHRARRRAAAGSFAARAGVGQRDVCFASAAARRARSRAASSVGRARGAVVSAWSRRRLAPLLSTLTSPRRRCCRQGAGRGLAIYLTAISAESPWQRAWAQMAAGRKCVDVGRRSGGAGRPWRSPTLAVRRIARWTGPETFERAGGETDRRGGLDSRRSWSFATWCRGRERTSCAPCGVSAGRAAYGATTVVYATPSATTATSRRSCCPVGRHCADRRADGHDFSAGGGPQVPSGALIRRRSTSSRRRSASATAPR